MRKQRRPLLRGDVSAILPHRARGRFAAVAVEVVTGLGALEAYDRYRDGLRFILTEGE